MAHAQLVVGESATMSSEAAVLGVPAVFIATTGRGYTDDEEKRLRAGPPLHRGANTTRAVGTIEELFADSPRDFGRAARERLLAEKIDVTQWMIDYFESTFAAAK